MSEFIEFLHEVFEAFGPITARKIFGFVEEDVLYLKVDQATGQQFAHRGGFLIFQLYCGLSEKKPEHPFSEC